MRARATRNLPGAAPGPLTRGRRASSRSSVGAQRAGVDVRRRSSSRGTEPVGLIEQREQQVLDVDLGVPVAQRLGLRVVQRLLRFWVSRFGSMRSPRWVGSS